MEQLQLLLRCAAIGVRDSVWGVVKFFQIAKDYYLSTKPRKSSSTSQSSRKKKFEENDFVFSFLFGRDSHVFTQIIKCFALNGLVFWLSIEFFNGILVPGAQTCIEFFTDSGQKANFIWSWFYPALSLLFSLIWEIPLFLMSKLINCLWFQDIAEMAFRHGGGRRSQTTSLSKLVADFLFSAVVQSFFLVQTICCRQFLMSPFGDILYLIFMSFLYSLYAFEYKWYNMGWELHKRLSFIENNWPYFIAFGMPLAVLTTLVNSYFVSCAVFAILFPLQIVAANDAEPVVGVCDFSIRFFSLVVWVSNHLFQRTINLKRPTTNANRKGGPSSARAKRS